jgi:peptidoglycan-N-acetylglucosamine deacetylase
MAFVFMMSLFGLSAHAKEIAISIDDVPVVETYLYKDHLERAKKLIESVKKLKIPKPVVFCNTDRLNEEDRRAHIQLYSDAGFILGNHTQSHKKISAIGVDAYIEEIKEADSVLKGYKNSVKWFRYPYLDRGETQEIHDKIKKELQAMKYKIGYVTACNANWKIWTALIAAMKEKKKVDIAKLKTLFVESTMDAVDYYDKLAVTVLGRSPRQVLLMHEFDTEVLGFEDVIMELQKRGWKIISPVKAYQDPVAKAEPKTLFFNRGMIAAIADAKGVKDKNRYQSDFQAGMDEKIKERKIFE